MTIVAACAFAAAAACSSGSGSSGGSACPTYVTPASTDLTTPTVSFANDVMPILTSSCGLLVGCHGSSDPGGNEAGMYLGSDAAQTLQAIVGVPATTLPTMARVKPGDPTQSFIMHKLDHDQCAFDAQCKQSTCGAGMPFGGRQLTDQTRDVIRRWIAQGAHSN